MLEFSKGGSAWSCVTLINAFFFFQETTYGHEHREANGEAHRLAKMATTLAVGRHFWSVDPQDHLCIPVTLIQ
jgi:hypothetical protein